MPFLVCHRRACLSLASRSACFAQHLDQPTGSPSHFTILTRPIARCRVKQLSIDFFLLVAAWVRSRAERPSVSYTKVSAVSLGQANSCNYTNRNKFKQNSGSNKFLIAGDGKMKRNARAVRPNSLARCIE